MLTGLGANVDVTDALDASVSITTDENGAVDITVPPEQRSSLRYSSAVRAWLPVLFLWAVPPRRNSPSFISHATFKSAWLLKS